VKLELSAFTPFAPLDSGFLDAAGRVGVSREKPDCREADGFAAALMQNPVATTLGAAINGVSHDKFGGNVNERSATERPSA